MAKKTKAIVQTFTPQADYTPVDSDFVLKDNAGEIAIDTNFASQSFWKDVTKRFVNKRSAVVGTVLVIFIIFMAIIGPHLHGYDYS